MFNAAPQDVTALLQIWGEGDATAMDRLALDDVRGRLAPFDRCQTNLELRFFGGWNVEDTAGTWPIPPQSVMRDWKPAEPWLERQVG